MPKIGFPDLEYPLMSKPAPGAALMLAVAALSALGGCVTRPMGPTVAVMPGNGKPFDAFQQDQAVCKQYADQQVAGSENAANNQQVGTALLGTVLGAAIGGGRGAGIGAASGAVVGTGIGAGNAQQAQYSLQQRYDISYMQCMSAKGNQVPGYGPPPP
jgi:uncharacterized protein YcfJ